MKRAIDRDLSPRDVRSRSRYSDRDALMREPVFDNRDRREREDGRAMKMRARDDFRDRDDIRERDDIRDRGEVRSKGFRDKDIDFEFDRRPPPKRYRDDRYPEERSPLYRERPVSPPPFRSERGPARSEYRIPIRERTDPRDRVPFRDRSPPSPLPSTGPEFRSLCITKINPRVTDAALRDVLYNEFKMYGEFNVKVVQTATARIAYVNFRFPDDAKKALAVHSRLVLFDGPVQVDPVRGKRDRRGTPPQMKSRYDSYQGRAPPPRRSCTPPLHRPVIKHNDEYERGPVRPVTPPPFRHDPNGESSVSPQHPRPKNPPKFPHHLNHINPEDDAHACRNLFIGNLDMGITEDEIREAFSRFGIIEDVDIKKPARQGTGNAYAFLKYKNLDMAHRAKVALSGNKVGKFNCKIGYGQIVPTKCLWVGGVGPWIKPEDLEKEFDRFGVIMSTFWPGGKNYAFILYDDVEACKAAHDGMRGAALGGPDRRIRTDYVEPEEIPPRGPGGVLPPGEPGQPPPPGFDSWQDLEPSFARRSSRDRVGRSPFRDDYPPGEEPPGFRPRDRSPSGNGDAWRHRSRTPEPAFNNDFPRERGDGRPPSPRYRGRSNDRRSIESGRRNPDLDRLKSAMEMPKYLPKSWEGGMVLKSSAFPTEMHLVEGDRSLVDVLLRDPGSKGGGTLKITQRLRLLQPKLDDLNEKIEAAKVRGQYCILLAVNAPGHVVDNPTNSLQIRPLRNLVTYLEQKDSAGVISLPPGGSKNKDNVGVLHAFPPCQFSRSLLLRQAPNIVVDAGKDEYLLVVVLRGAA